MKLLESMAAVAAVADREEEEEDADGAAAAEEDPSVGSREHERRAFTGDYY